MLSGKRLLLIIGGGIAAYKVLELIRRLRDRGVDVRCVLTKAGAEFVTPLSVAALSENKVYQDLFSLTDESEMGHIRLSREADLVLVAPATANLIAKMAAGIADDLATTALLATDKPVLIAPAMNTHMWQHAATQANVATLIARGITVIGPAAGDLACGEVGSGRLVEVPGLLAALEEAFHQHQPLPSLVGKHAIVTSGPTHEPIDPVRYIANRSSGKQGHAIAAALAAAGMRVTLVSGPTQEPVPAGVDFKPIESAQQMLAAVDAALPADLFVGAAAVADWRVASAADQKLKKGADGPPALVLTENPDILRTVSQHPKRPALVIGFAAETEKVLEHAAAKRVRKGCDWILANDVSPETGTFGGTHSRLFLVTAAGVTPWPHTAKTDAARRLTHAVAEYFSTMRDA
ncbi:bifunctional phosphopantothenoylcysteine decarboxylase/phosphopantothenate--cysteine ligase CoaBC [Elstera cyanobacteriorum]|uniref:bifunctional phosphopantothenoylcysteine decarboxylase/phosphopantothenate--cysteine ligase CoaBC n=1 Tax=Elstera cyanobacteriorum TaxID=2022747 RepID=UPI0023554CAD|nr:bifunctional phosphopantothenoylcysteine decarboxylase/phosphopantothenate--cysteine ligase CoaBC [Elstera cyanobacteriorum]MCK6443065.1 bifunctional phosphopantothenoylcysteine decarboxylase/phosphopantothenate--cysteine ligase CoaBC [Elstera cyanobacteriorum]